MAHLSTFPNPQKPGPVREAFIHKANGEETACGRRTAEVNTCPSWSLVTCARCLRLSPAEAFPVHAKDSDCRVDPDLNSCQVCGVDHSGPRCGKCGGRAFHALACPVYLAEKEGA